jgi:CubicO group peptidase (beta-lactamase class C family)
MRFILPSIVVLAAIVAGVAPCSSVAAASRCDSAQISARGFDPARLCAALADFEAGGDNLHGLVIERHGAVVAERYRSGTDRSVYSLFSRTVDFDAGTRHDLRSISKSVTGLLWGIAQAEHKTPPLDARVLDLFPELAGLKADGRQDITIGHLLDMTSGLAWDESGNYGLGNAEFQLYWRSSQARYVLDRPMAHPAGQRFSYNGGSTAILAELLARGVGMPLPDYARSRLFAPLGITEWEWMRDIRGRPLAFSGLRMRPRDLARIGQLILQHGRWDGVQIVPEAWVAASLQPRTEVGDGRQYGYQWWHGQTRALGRKQAWTAGFGNGGQRLFVVPALDLVVVITAGLYDDEAGAIRVNRLFHRIAAAIDR